MNLKTLTPNLMVEDVRQTINYYHGVLSFNTIDSIENSEGDLIRATVQKGEVKIMFQSEDSLKKELPELRHDEPAGGFTIFIEMEGVDDYYDYLFSSSDIVDQIKNKSGYKQFTVRDVNGYYLTFGEKI
ncbi:hypothetical protein E1176_11880 [Fulvivirga sp. RKSG066]|uniref:hypothetical protein n=1 Tax=Fulvivirga aurantia TaxID=2529383 RepID=UPI0012BC99E9|nr:hypothetical protein [Fulvivirga aurantia]MTI21722.1 hypothetical protein [Fulvivirga aurantia]